MWFCDDIYGHEQKVGADNWPRCTVCVWKVTLAQIAHPEWLHANMELGVRPGGAFRACAETTATT